MKKSSSGNGKESRLVEAFYEYEDSLRRYVLKRLSVEEEARDIVQEIFVRLIQMENHQHVHNRRSYLFEMANNLAIDRIRQRERERLRFNSDYIASLDAPSDDIPPEQLLHYRQRFQSLMSVLKDMPESWRKALVMHRWQNMTYQEIGDALGVTHHAVKKYLAKAVVFCQVRMGKLD